MRTGNYLKVIGCQWQRAWKDRYFRFKVLAVPGLFIAYSIITQGLGNYIEMRPGIQLEDRLLSFLPAIDFSGTIFLLLYSSMLLVLMLHINKPCLVMKILEMHLLVAVARQLCILLFALEPPVGMIQLRDVLLENTFYPPEKPMTKDLFFSGHVASIWIYFLSSQIKYFKIYMIFATLCMSFMVLSMRVHYTYDVYGAIIITTLIYYWRERMRKYYVSKKLPGMVHY